MNLYVCTVCIDVCMYVCMYECMYEGQTKMKSVLVDFLVSAGIKPVAIVSYNHLGKKDPIYIEYLVTYTYIHTYIHIYIHSFIPRKKKN